MRIPEITCSRGPVRPSAISDLVSVTPSWLHSTSLYLLWATILGASPAATMLTASTYIDTAEVFAMVISGLINRSPSGAFGAIKNVGTACADRTGRPVRLSEPQTAAGVCSVAGQAQRGPCRLLRGDKGQPVPYRRRTRTENKRPLIMRGLSELAPLFLFEHYGEVYRECIPF